MGDADSPLHVLFLLAKQSPFQASFLPLLRDQDWPPWPQGSPAAAMRRRPPPQHRFVAPGPNVVVHDYDLFDVRAEEISVLTDVRVSDDSIVLSDADW
eukprot:85401-Lingulodinium_polyedra.AAC.1